MNDSNINIGISLDRNTKAKLQAELNKIKGLNVNVQADTSSITSSVQKAINDALKNIKVGEIKLPQVSSKYTESIFDKYKNGINTINDFINTIDKTKKITELFKNFGRPKIFGLKSLNVLKLPNIISVLWDTKVFLWSNVKYTG